MRSSRAWIAIALIALVVAIVAILVFDGTARWTGLAVAGGLGVAAALSFGAQPRDAGDVEAPPLRDEFSDR